MKTLLIAGLTVMSFNSMAKDVTKVLPSMPKSHSMTIGYKNLPGFIRGKGITTLKIKGAFSYAKSSTGGELSLYNIVCQVKAKVCVASVQVLTKYGVQNELQTLKLVNFKPGVFLLERNTGLSTKFHWYHIDVNRGLAFDVIRYVGPKGKRTIIFPISQYKYGYRFPLERQQ